MVGGAASAIQTSRQQIFRQVNGELIFFETSFAARTLLFFHAPRNYLMQIMMTLTYLRVVVVDQPRNNPSRHCRRLVRCGDLHHHWRGGIGWREDAVGVNIV